MSTNLATTTTNEGSKQIAVEGGTLQDRLRLLEEQRQRDAAKLVGEQTDVSQVTDELIRERVQWMDDQKKAHAAGGTTPGKKAAIVVKGGGLKDRLAQLEETRQKEFEKLEAAKQKHTTDPSQVTDDIIRERVQWMDGKGKDGAQLASKAAIVVEGGGLKDRLAQLEASRQKEAEKLVACRRWHTTDPSQVSDDLIRERLKWMESSKNDAKTLEKTAIVIEGGGVKDRLKLLEEQRQREASRLVSKTTSLSAVSDDLIRERLRWMDEQMNTAKDTGNTKTAIIVEGGNLQERLKLLDEQRRRQEERAANNNADLAMVTDDLIRERLQWLDEQQRLHEEAQGASKENNIVIQGGNLRERKQLLEEQRRREQERLAVRRLVENVSSESLQVRIQWLSQQQEQPKDGSSEEISFISSDLIAERLMWLKDSAEKAAQLPEKERIEVTNDLVKQRKAWLDEQMQKAATLPPKERIEVTHGLIIERMSWLTEQMNKANTLSHKERTQMTTDLIAERLAYLEAQIQAQAADAEARANLEMQINFLEEQQQVADKMTDDEQMVMANVLITEKIQDLEQQKELITEISEDQQLEVTQTLLEDRQAWLEGDQEHFSRRREDQKRAQEQAQAQALEQQETTSRMLDEVTRTVTFWREQKATAITMSPPERAQVTAFLIAEHVVTLEVQLEDPDVDDDTRASLQQQIEFLNDQLEIVNDIDHLTMINVLVDEKVANLEKMLETL